MNYKKYILIALLAVLFVTAGLYNTHNYKDYMYYLNNPDNTDKTEIGIAGTVISREGHDLLIRESMFGKEVLLKSVYENWQPGQFINFKGIYHKEGYIDFIKGELIWNKKIKLYFSIVGFLVFLYIVFKDYKKLRFGF